MMEPLEALAQGVLGTAYEAENPEGEEYQVSVHLLGHHDFETGTTRVVQMKSDAEPPVTAMLLDGEGCIVAVARGIDLDAVLELLDMMELNVPVG